MSEPPAKSPESGEPNPQKETERLPATRDCPSWRQEQGGGNEHWELFLLAVLVPFLCGLTGYSLVHYVGWLDQAVLPERLDRMWKIVLPLMTVLLATITALLRRLTRRRK